MESKNIYILYACDSDNNWENAKHIKCFSSREKAIQYMCSLKAELTKLNYRIIYNRDLINNDSVSMELKFTLPKGEIVTTGYVYVKLETITENDNETVTDYVENLYTSIYN